MTSKTKSSTLCFATVLLFSAADADAGRRGIGLGRSVGSMGSSAVKAKAVEEAIKEEKANQEKELGTDGPSPSGESSDEATTAEAGEQGSLLDNESKPPFAGGGIPRVAEESEQGAAVRTEVELFPNLREALGYLKVSSTDGEFLAGKALVGAAAGAVAATQLYRYLHALALVASRSPAVASFVIVNPETATLTLNLTELGLRADEVRAFFRSDAAEQRSLCGLTAYRSFCSKLTAVEYDIAYLEGRGA